MQDLLRQIDLNYHRSALLLVARTELDRVRQESSAGADVERWGKTSFGVAPMAERAGSPEVACAGPPYSGSGAVRRE